jgi:hypothetical protein
MPPIIDMAGPIDASRDQRPVVAVVEVSYCRRDRSRLRRADEGTNVLVVTPFLFLSGRMKSWNSFTSNPVWRCYLGPSITINVTDLPQLTKLSATEMKATSAPLSYQSKLVSTKRILIFQASEGRATRTG